MQTIIMKFIYVMTVIFSLMICSCADDFTYYNGEIPEGEGNLTATVTFTPTVAANLYSTRTAGNVIQDINSLCVLVYTTDGKLVRKYNQGDLTGYTTGKYTVKDEDHLDGNEAHTDEMTTATASFALSDLPYGRYKIYAVANMDDLNKYDTEIQTEEGLRNIKLNWDSENIAANNQMFGYFTPESAKSAKGFDAPALAFTPDNSSFHAWLNRVVSKVTIAFDASGLNQDVTIYIRNVTIRDIPESCVLGNTNTPKSDSELLNHLSTPYSEPDYTHESSAIANTRFEYNSEGIIENPDEQTGPEKTDGYKLQNQLRQPVPEDAHAVNAASLFFFENNQGDFDNQTKYDKRQQTSDETDGVGTPIRDKETDADGNITNDFKDKVPYGTYIEVEAYYISANPGRIGEGSIKYRFMLGKNITYNYNAQRNYHFKLTLGFNGWANQPDWHIDYEQPEPGIEVQPEFRVSYLYNQKSELPIRILEGSNYTIESINVEIVENNWAPYDPETRGVPPAETDITPNPTYAFKWNKAAYESAPYMINGQQVPYYGFLALHHPLQSQDSEVITADFSLSSNKALEAYYLTMHEGDRSFSGDTELSIGDHSGPSEDDAYTVTPVLDEKGDVMEHQKTLMVPVWTRAKTLIRGSGFSGNNPYEGYERKAKLKITATFRRTDGTPYEPEPEYVDVYQVKRLVNPKGVWRAADRNEVFHVTLLEAESGNDMADFRPFTSEGEWEAFIEGQTNETAGFYITQNSETVGYQDEEGIIHGYTGSEIHFDINFDKVTVSATEPECAIVKVLYHGNQCLHKILIRKGYDQPVEMGGNKWSSFSLYQATYIDGADGTADRYNAVLTKNPLMLGSMFRRGRQSRGIFVVNNIAEDGGVGPFEAPGDYQFLVGRKDNDGNWLRQTWDDIGYRDDRNTSNTLGTFYEGNYTYRVPTYADFRNLTTDAEFGFGVVYGSSATAPARTAADAYGLIDPYNEGLFDDPRGMRGVIAYKKDTGNQIFFPMGKYGTGRRNNFIMTGANAGVLRYGDVDYLLEIGLGNNLYRPIPYNLMVQSGNIYWIDKYTSVEEAPELSNACLGWDINYFNFDFNPYPTNNYRDACPIKFIIVD
ncbi:MAG: hypothetical protein HDS13_02250 [Bacteroides sp.]|nr:hypothetical protein [Bacteroides sp.]